MKKTLFITLALTATALAYGQAADNASNAPYIAGQEYIQVGTTPGDQTAAVNGLNGGYGFNKWQRGGYGSPTNAGSTLITNLAPSFNMGTQQFGMRSAPDGSEGADARRRLNNDIPTGGWIGFSLMAGGNGAGQLNSQGEFGVEIRGSSLSNPGRDMVGLYGSNGANWRVFGNMATINTAIPVIPGQRLDVRVIDLGGNSFQFDLTPFGGSTLSYVQTSISAGVKMRTAQFYVYNTNGDYYINNLQAVPEPATLLALAGGAAVIGLRRRRK